ncbi:Cyanovirin-N [Macrophomina phaseolina]|uniref:Cyanovirin-N n=1 Tax=Macrophomina phaseolina TaxID=35725 RepID=A0ABQ8GIL4_9PEZI|nr:Cyanovirin-N [Macrophomina phaseolina]
MSFTKSSSTIAISEDSLLSAKCRACNGEWRESSIRLNDFLGNNDGSFMLGDRDFSMTAKDIALEQTEDASLLRATLRKRDGSWQDASVELDAFISNQDGELCL